MSGLTSQHIAPGTHESMPEVALSSTRQLAPGVSLPVTCVHFVASHASPPSEAYAAHLRPSAHIGAHGSQAAPSPPPVVLLLALPSSALVSPVVVPVGATLVASVELPVTVAVASVGATLVPLELDPSLDPFMLAEPAVPPASVKQPPRSSPPIAHAVVRITVSPSEQIARPA